MVLSLMIVTNNRSDIKTEGNHELSIITSSGTSSRVSKTASRGYTLVISIKEPSGNLKAPQDEHNSDYCNHKN